MKGDFQPGITLETAVSPFYMGKLVFKHWSVKMFLIGSVAEAVPHQEPLPEARPISELIFDSGSYVRN